MNVYERERYTETIAELVRLIQELDKRVEAIEKELSIPPAADLPEPIYHTDLPF